MGCAAAAVKLGTATHEVAHGYSIFAVASYGAGYKLPVCTVHAVLVDGERSFHFVQPLFDCCSQSTSLPDGVHFYEVEQQAVLASIAVAAAQKDVCLLPFLLASQNVLGVAVFIIKHALRYLAQHVCTWQAWVTLCAIP